MREPTPYLDLPWAEPYPTAAELEEDAEPPSLPRERERETLHPNDPRFRGRAVEWARRDVERETIMGNGAVVPFGWIRHSEDARLARLGDDDAREAERRRLEEERICWCEDVPPRCWPDEAAAGWCDLGHGGFGDERTWDWCNEDRIAWCLDEGGGWQDDDAGFWEGVDGGWCDEGDAEVLAILREMAEAEAIAWCSEWEHGW